MDEADRMLTFETQWWHRAGAKETAIRDQFGMSAVAYYQRLVRIVNDPAPELAVKHGPVLLRLRAGMERQARLRRAS